MKKYLILTFLFFSSSIAFTQNYKTYLSKAKEYEEKKEYVYALGYYFDAMNDENANDEASQYFDNLSSKLSKGPDGLGLSLWDDPKEAWEKVIKNYYKYFTEFSPYEFSYYDQLVRGDLDYKNKTATYLMDYDFSLTDKFKKISSILTKYTFNDEKPFYWYLSNKPVIKSDAFSYIYNDNNKIPYTSFTFDSVNTSEYLQKIQDLDLQWKREVEKEGIDIYSRTITMEDSVKALEIKEKYSIRQKNLIAERNSKLHSEIMKYYKQNGIALSVSSNDSKASIVLASFSSFYDTCHFYMDGNYLPYDFIFGIYDKTGKLIIQGSRQCAYLQENRKSIYAFSGIPESIMKLIDDNEYSIKPIDVYLNYGAFRSSGYKENASEQEIRSSYLKNALEIKQDLNKILIVNGSERDRKILEEEMRKKEEKIKKMEEERKEKERKYNYSKNLSDLDKIISEYLNNSNLLGFEFDLNNKVLAVGKNSTAKKVKIKPGDTVRFPYTEIKDFNAEHIIESLDLKSTMEEKHFTYFELESFINQFLNNERHLVKNGVTYSIIPLKIGDTVTFSVTHNKNNKEETVTLTVEEIETSTFNNNTKKNIISPDLLWEIVLLLGGIIILLRLFGLGNC